MNKRSLLALLVSPILVAGTAALAQDAKMFPGAMCQPQIESDTALVRDSFSGGIFNESSSEEVRETLLCPIVRDVTAGGRFETASIILCVNNLEPLGQLPPEARQQVFDAPNQGNIDVVRLVGVTPQGEPDPEWPCQLVSNRRTGAPVDTRVDDRTEVEPGIFQPSRASRVPIEEELIRPICAPDDPQQEQELILLEFAHGSPNIQSAGLGHYFFRCIPDFEEGVISYRTQEND